MGRSKHCTPEELRIIKNLRNAGKTLKFIAENLDRSINFVANALKRTPAAETRGRPRKTTSVTDARIVLLAKKDPFMSSKAIAAEINNIISPPTVRKRLQQSRLPGRIARKVPLLSRKNIRNRRQFALGLQAHTVERFRNILWSDETKINLFGSDCKRNV